MIPYERRQLDLGAVAYDIPKLLRSACEALIEVVEHNGWLPITEMQASVDDPWEPYERRRAAAFAVKRGVRFRARPEVALEASIANSGRSVAVTAYLTAEVFESRPIHAVEDWLVRALAAFPQARVASAGADKEQTAFKLERGLFPAPLFYELGWLHVMTPSAYPAVYERAALLAAPCYRVEERTDGTIWFWVYEHPLRYDTPEAREAIATLNHYLQAHRRS